MENRVLVLFLAVVLSACAAPTKQPDSAISSADAPYGSKSLFGAGNNVTLSSDTLSSAEGSPPRPSNRQVAVRKPPQAPQAHPSNAPSPSYQQGVSYWIERISPSGGTQRVNASTVFSTGDRIVIHARSSRPGYLYVVNQDSSGRSSFLFPSSAQGNEYIEPSRTYRIPASGHLRFDEQTGQEVVWLFLSQRPLPVDNLQAQSSGYNTPSQSLQPTAYPAQEIGYNSCGSKQLVVESPETLSENCGVPRGSGGGKGLVVEEDDQGPEPATKVSLPSELAKKGQILALRIVLRHN